MADYSSVTLNSGIKVDLTNTADATYEAFDNGFGGKDKLENIEEIWGSSFGDVFIAGSDNDTIYGQGGDDLFISSATSGENYFFWRH